MTTEKYINIYQHKKLSPDQINGLLRDLDDPDTGITRQEAHMRRTALESLKRIQFQKSNQ
jgi:hypothetical protein